MDKITLIDYYNRMAEDRQRWKKRSRYYYQQLERYFSFLIPEGSSVIEIGCGTGELLNAVKPSRGLGIDFSPEMIKIARNKFPNLEFRVEDAENLKTEEKFDYVILSDLIGTLYDIQMVFREVKKICSPKARVVISYYNYLWEPVLKLGEKFKLKTPLSMQSWLSLSDIENLLYLNDFEVIKKGYKLIFPKYLPLISNFLNRFIANLPIFRRLCLTEIVIARPKPSCGEKESNANCTCSVIICCRNEKGNIRPNIKRIPDLGKHTEIIFVEGHSRDGTMEEIKKQIREFPDKDIKVFMQDGIGKADALRKGFTHAQGDILIVLDADLTVPPEDLVKFYDVLASGKGEFVMGSRLVYPIEEGAMRFLNLIGNRFFGLVFSYLLEQGIKDTLCANKALFREDYLKIEKSRHFFGNFDPFGDFDLIFGASRYNLKIVEIPVRYNARKYGTTQISRFCHGWLLLKMCWFALWKLKMV